MSWVPGYLSINRLTVKYIYIFTSALFHCLSMQRKISAVSMCLLASSRTEQTEVWYPILNVLLVYFLFSLPYIIINLIIIHQTHYEKSDWSRAFNQFTIACELDMINAISAADIAFIMSSSMSAWLPSPLECSPQKQNG